jgi:hypothetical protein
MNNFDPAIERRTLVDILDRKARDAELSDKTPVLSLSLTLNSVVTAWLVGLKERAAPVLTKLHAALERCVAVTERPPFEAMTCHQDCALSHWLLTGQATPDLLAKAAELGETAFRQRVWNDADPEAADHSLYLGNFLGNCLQSGQYARGIRECERLGERLVAGPESIRSDVEFGYWACRYRLGTDTIGDDYVTAGERMLRNKLEAEWLGRGHATRAANWLKVVYWDTKILGDPLATLLKAYDLMPHVERPPWLTP